MAAVEAPDSRPATSPAEPAQEGQHGRRAPATQEEPAATGHAGPLFAIVALCGGAGASTLAYLVARSAAERSNGPVLVCDGGGPTGGLAAYARVESPRSLPRTANAIAARESFAGGLFADAAPGLRVIAAGPHLDTETDAAGLDRLLDHARAAHALTVADCGSAGDPTEQQVLSAATHVAWVLPATISGVRRAAAVLELFRPRHSTREVVVARHDGAGRPPPSAELEALAGARGAPLVLMPHVPDLVEGDDRDAGLAAAAVTLEAIRGVLRR